MLSLASIGRYAGSIPLAILDPRASTLLSADRSLQLLQKCEEQDSSVLEVYMAKGVVLKHAGDLEGAAEACYTAQSLDTADRQACKLLYRGFSQSLLP